MKNKMATNIVCYYNLAPKQGITIVLPVVINKIGKEKKKKEEKQLNKSSRLSQTNQNKTTTTNKTTLTIKKQAK